MNQGLLFGISVLLSFVAWGFVVGYYVWPRLRNQSRVEALRPILILHSFRFVGLAFLIPGVVALDLPARFAVPAAYGDLAATILALISILVLRTRIGLAVVWLFNLTGTLDLLNAFYQGNSVGLGLRPGIQGATYFIPTVLVPLMLITHGLAFWLLLRRTSKS